MMKKLLVGLTALLLAVAVAGPASAIWMPPMPSNDIKVENDSYANISNNVVIEAYTGSNTTLAGNGGNGGFTFCGTANGGNGGTNSSDITTGNIDAKVKIVNVANTNITKIKTPCFGCTGKIKVENEDSDAIVGNGVAIGADTGLNATQSGEGGKGGVGGSTDGGQNGGSNSSSITTGNIDAKAKVVNVVNTNITRITRTGFSY